MEVTKPWARGKISGRRCQWMNPGTITYPMKTMERMTTLKSWYDDGRGDNDYEDWTGGYSP